MPTFPSPHLSIKQIYVIEAVAKYNGFALAADHLHMTQSVISRTIKAAEKQLNLDIFQRGWSGAEPTPKGEIVVSHCHNALAEMRETETYINNILSVNIHLRGFLKWHHLQAIAAVVKFGSVTKAAKNLHQKQPAISRAIMAVSAYFRQPIFERNRQGLKPSMLALRLSNLFSSLQITLENLNLKLNDKSGGMQGRVAVGMLPFSGQDLVAKAFGKLTREHPNLRLIAVSGSYSMLMQALRQGEIDCIMGMLRQPSLHDDLVEIYVYEEQYTLVARKDHACHNQKVTATILQNFVWICAPYGSPVREYLEIFFKHYGLTPPTQTCEIHSFANAEQMIIESNSIALLSYSQQKLIDLRTELKCVDIEMPNAKNAVGLTFLASEIISDPLIAFKSIILRLANKV